MQYNIAFLTNYCKAGHPQIVIAIRLQWAIPARGRSMLKFSLTKKRVNG